MSPEQYSNETDEAVAHGGQLIVFPEAFIPGYSAFIWGLRPGL